MDDFKTLEDFKERCGYDIDGTWFPRVTQIVSVIAKPALYFFYAGLKNFAEGERIKKISADEGTRIHEAAESIFTGSEPVIAPDIQPSITALRKFLAETNIEVDPEHVEERVVNFEHKYAGTLDAIALIDGKLGIMDIKTSQAIYRDYNLQTSAYMASLKDEIKDLQTRWILRIDQARVCTLCGAKLRSKGGRDKVIIDRSNPFMRACNHTWSETPVGEVELEEFPLWEADFEAFLGAKRLWEWKNEDWLKAAGYLE